MKRASLAFLVMMLLTACRGQQPLPATSATPLPDFPIEPYRSARPDQNYRLLNDLSRVDIIVRRGGSLARFGHDHVVSTTDISGILLVDREKPELSMADLRLDLDSLVVDQPELRRQYRLDTVPSEEDIRKTTANMQSRVLQTQIWPQVHLHLEATSGSMEELEARVTVDLHGQQHSFSTRVDILEPDGDTLLAQGRFTLRQSEYGIEPFSVLGGGLQVLDEVEVNYRLTARRLSLPNS